MKINTTQAVADSLNITPARVRQLVRELGLEPVYIGKAIVLSDADVKKMRNRKQSMGPVKNKKSKVK